MQSSSSRLRLFPLLLCAFAFTLPASAEPAIETTPLAPLNALSIHIHESGRFSAVTRQGSRMVVTIDGEAGPRFDRFLGASGQPMVGRTQMAALNTRDAGDHPVVFSADGSRHAYIGLQGDEYVVVVDGKEVHRGPYEVNVVTPVRFSPKGKHFWFMAAIGQNRAYHFFMDGRQLPERMWDTGSVPAFNADETRYAVSTTTNVNRAEGRLMVDGKLASYFGVKPQFLPNGKLLVHGIREGGYNVLLLDGKPLNPDISVGNVSISANNRIAGVTNKGVWLDGKIVAGTEGARELVFSPDGKRLAVTGSSGTGRDWLWLDGKRSDHYQTMQAMGPIMDRVRTVFTADSSVNLAYGFNGGLFFPLINGQESDGFKFARDPVLAAKGSGFGYIVTFENQQSGVVINGKLYTSSDWRIGSPASSSTVVQDSLGFSADGSRTTFVVGGRDPVLYIDGKPVSFPDDLAPQPWLISGYGQGDPTTVIFSRDGKRTAYVGRTRKGYVYHVCVDGHSIWTHEGGVRRSPTFTPDGKHLFWLNRERAQGRSGSDDILYANGQRVMAVNYQTSPMSDLLRYEGTIRMGDDGKLRLITGTADGFVRHTISPSPSFGIDAAITAALSAAKGMVEAVAGQVESITATRAEAAPLRAQAVRMSDASAMPTAPVEPLTWSQLVRKREAWPAKATINRELRFSDGATVRAGSEIEIVELKAKEVVARGNRGAVMFAVEPEATTVLEAANADWAALTPAQRDLTYAKLARSPELWPYEVKLSVPIELSGAPSQRAGSRVLMLNYEKNQLLVRIPNSSVAFNIEAENTDILAQARNFLADERGAPGRLVQEFAAAKLVHASTGRRAQLNTDARPKYVVMYMGAGWCPPCRVFAPKLVGVLKEKAPAEEDVALLFLSGDKTAGDAKKYASGLGIDWPMLSFTSRAQIPAFQTLFGDSIPQLVVTDRHGVVVIDSAKVGQDRALAQLRELL